MRDLLLHSRNLIKKMCMKISFKKEGKYIFTTFCLPPALPRAMGRVKAIFSLISIAL
jgi:hypothetical protein